MVFAFLTYDLFSNVVNRLTLRTLLGAKSSDDFYYRGYIDDIDNKIHVRFYAKDDQISFAFNDHVGIVRDVVPREVMVRRGRTNTRFERKY